jgi:hypothetical protein
MGQLAQKNGKSDGAQGDALFLSIFGAAAAVTIIEAVRRSR